MTDATEVWEGLQEAGKEGVREEWRRERGRVREGMGTEDSKDG